MYCNYFYEAFFSKSPQVFAELTTFKSKAFGRFLKKIYPCHMRVGLDSDGNVEDMLEMAEFLGCEYIKNECEKFLIPKLSFYAVFKVVFFAFNYGLKKLQVSLNSLVVYCDLCLFYNIFVVFSGKDTSRSGPSKSLAKVQNV